MGSRAIVVTLTLVAASCSGSDDAEPPTTTTAPPSTTTTAVATTTQPPAPTTTTQPPPTPEEISAAAVRYLTAPDLRLKFDVVGAVSFGPSTFPVHGSAAVSGTWTEMHLETNAGFAAAGYDHITTVSGGTFARTSPGPWIDVGAIAGPEMADGLGDWLGSTSNARYVESTGGSATVLHLLALEPQKALHPQILGIIDEEADISVEALVDANGTPAELHVSARWTLDSRGEEVPARLDLGFAVTGTGPVVMTVPAGTMIADTFREGVRHARFPADLTGEEEGYDWIWDGFREKRMWFFDFDGEVALEDMAEGVGADINFLGGEIYDVGLTTIDGNLAIRTAFHYVVDDIPSFGVIAVFPIDERGYSFFQIGDQAVEDAQIDAFEAFLDTVRIGPGRSIGVDIWQRLASVAPDERFALVPLPFFDDEMRSVGVVTGFAEGPGGLIAVGGDSIDNGGAAWTSSAGYSWNTFGAESFTEKSNLWAVVPGGPGYVGVGRFGQGEVSLDDEGAGSARVWTSPDGVTWSQAYDDAGQFTGAVMFDVAAGPLVFAAVGTDGFDPVVWTSPDGRTWQRTYDPNQENINAMMLAVTAGPGLMVAAGRTSIDAGLWTSTDGRDWKQVPGGPELAAAVIHDVTWTGSEYVAVGTDSDFGSTQAYAWTSPDGATWTRTALAPDLRAVSLSAVVPWNSGVMALGTSVAGDNGLWVYEPGRGWVDVPVPSGFPDTERLRTLHATDTALLIGGQESITGHAGIWRAERSVVDELATEALSQIDPTKTTAVSRDHGFRVTIPKEWSVSSTEFGDRSWETYGGPDAVVRVTTEWGSDATTLRDMLEAAGNTTGPGEPTMLGGLGGERFEVTDEDGTVRTAIDLAPSPAHDLITLYGDDVEFRLWILWEGENQSGEAVVSTIAMALPVLVLPGETRLAPVAQSRALESVLLGISASRDCDDLVVTDTIPDGEPPLWSEDWELDACGEQVTTTVFFEGEAATATVTFSILVG